MQDNKNILVTGGAGYIGSHTVVELLNAGFNPIIVDDLRNANAIVVDGIEKITHKKIALFQIDVCDFDAMDKLFQSYSFIGIIHFAAYKAVGESVEKPLDYYYNNLLGLIQLLKLSQKYKVQNFVFSSSCTVYGEPKETKIVSENTPLATPNSPYGHTKFMGEQVLKDFANSFDQTKVLALRYFNPIGAHPSALIGEYPIGKPNNLIPYITQCAIGKLKELTIFGDDYPTHDGTCVRDYIHVIDVAKAHVKGVEFLISQNKPTLEFVNIGTGKGTSVLSIVKTFNHLVPNLLKYTIGPKRPGDVSEIYANVEKATQLLQWKSEYTIEQALKDAWNWELYLAEKTNFTK